jgi:hypothetical protein
LPEIGNMNGDSREYRERLVKFVADHGIALEYCDIETLAEVRYLNFRRSVPFKQGGSFV